MNDILGLITFIIFVVQIILLILAYQTFGWGYLVIVAFGFAVIANAIDIEMHG